MKARRAVLLRATPGPLLLLASVLSVGMAGSASAQDGGARSLFATGGGLRGLAMGGAQTSLVRDAEALDWNPAGLGSVRRNEFALGRTSYFGQGVTESQAAAVFPSWRWGALALGVRHLGVGGVEGRDSRNQVTDEEFGASALQVALGYGRSVGGWSFGSALELQREQVAGTGANGIGLDLGVQMKPLDVFEMAPDWMEGVSLGATWTNVVAPSVRLDEDTVVDPAGFRLGVGFERPFLSGGSLVAALDIESSEVTETRVHSGLELRLHPSLALRSGLGERGVTAGAGFRWHDFDIDYVLEDTDLGSVHRVGFSYALGGTTEERRMAYTARQEQALQSRLEEASARREEQRIGQLLSEARALHSSGRHDDAIATIEVVRTLAPDRDDAIEIEALCWMERGGEFETAENYTDAALAYAHVLNLVPDREEALQAQARVQAESDRLAKRAENMRERYAQSLDAFGRGDLLKAKAGFTTLVRENRKDDEAKAMLRRTEDAIARKASDHVDQSRRLLARGLQSEAAAELQRARELVPDLDAIASVEADLARRRNASVGGSTGRGSAEAGTTRTDQESGGGTGTSTQSDVSAASAQSLPASGGSYAGSGDSAVRGGESRPTMSEGELSDLYRRGIEASQSERSSDAIRYFELVHSASPDHAQVRENLVREYLTVGMERFAKGDLDGAIGVWQRAIEVDPNDGKARGYLERALRHRNRSQEILGSSR